MRGHGRHDVRGTQRDRIEHGEGGDHDRGIVEREHDERGDDRERSCGIGQRGSFGGTERVGGCERCTEEVMT